MRDDNMQWDAVELDEGQPIPDISGYDALIVMGGPMDVWQEEQFPWLVPEKEAIYNAVKIRKMPFLGVCLGHQLLAEALGGSVGKAQTPEVGMLDVELTPQARTHRMAEGLPNQFKTLQWHGAEVKSLPENSTVLMSSPLCRVQSFAVDSTALGIQFHVETGPHTIDEWNAVAEYEQALNETFGPGGADKLRQGAIEHEASLTNTASILYRNWADICIGS